MCVCVIYIGKRSFLVVGYGVWGLGEDLLCYYLSIYLDIGFNRVFVTL